MYVSDLLHYEDLGEWAKHPQNVVFIESPTGSGKTSFVLKELLDAAQRIDKEILFLSNRVLLQEQVRAKVAVTQNLPVNFCETCNEDEFDGITVWSYQKIQKMIARGIKTWNFEERYAFIVFDEAHYILEDSGFNPEILWLLEFIRVVKVPKIFISATLKETCDFLMDSGLLGQVIGNLWEEHDVAIDSVIRRAENWNLQISLEQGGDERDFLPTDLDAGPRVRLYQLPALQRRVDVKYFENIDELVDAINSSEEKWLIFWGNKEKMKNFQKQLCVPSETFGTEDKGNEVAQEIIKTEKFSTQVLLTTKVLDNGVNLKDSRLKHIVIDTFSRTEFLQMLGRRRKLNEEEKFCLYIPKKSKSFFSAYLKCRIEPDLALIEEKISTEGRIKKMLADITYYQTVRRYFVIDRGEFCCNPAAKFLLEQQQYCCKTMLKALELDEWAFVKEQLSWLDMEATFSLNNSVSENHKSVALNELRTYLEQKSGVWLDKTRQDAFRKKVGELTEQAKIFRVKGKRLPGKKVIEGILAENGLPYQIVVKSGKKMGEESLWQVRRKDDDLSSTDEI